MPPDDPGGDRRADAAYWQWWLSVLTAGIIPRPEPDLELEAEIA